MKTFKIKNISGDLNVSKFYFPTDFSEGLYNVIKRLEEISKKIWNRKIRTKEETVTLRFLLFGDLHNNKTVREIENSPNPTPN
ncbi:hypothetical protein PNA2_1691 [Pyrococcus sp. NA2]|uniref:hypothetical protein n=1 Tax=Pyrococcus sp. (strain NA2) TaxID=342949 RepID=UPI000209AAAC|nr:hypothetical protein [Pyrococcus sp. NA2]AEC52606.1 hypothetical protein PNA2_1691 [Pyrococcus sp. NA2]